jgi:hypothetical protein
VAKGASATKGDDSLILAGARGRGEVARLCPPRLENGPDVHRPLPAEIERGLAIARAIRDPWYRCQSLAFVAEYLDDRRRPAVLSEAFKAAYELDEPNRIVTVASWPVEVLAELGPRDRLRQAVDRLLSVIATEPHSLRRADALAAVLHRVWPVVDVRSQVLGEFRAACAAGHGWRRDRLLRHTAQRMAEVDLAAATELVEMIEEDRTRRRAAREVAAVTPTPSRVTP